MKLQQVCIESVIKLTRGNRHSGLQISITIDLGLHRSEGDLLLSLMKVNRTLQPEQDDLNHGILCFMTVL